MLGPLAPVNTVAGRALRRSRPVGRGEFFLRCVTESLAQIADHAPHALIGVDIGVEDVPDTTGAWSHRVPLAAAQDATPDTLARIVVFRRPIEHRASNRRQLRSLVLRTLVEQVAALTGIPVTTLDPEGDDED